MLFSLSFPHTKKKQKPEHHQEVPINGVTSHNGILDVWVWFLQIPSHQLNGFPRRSSHQNSIKGASICINGTLSISRRKPFREDAPDAPAAMGSEGRGMRRFTSGGKEDDGWWRGYGSYCSDPCICCFKNLSICLSIYLSMYWPSNHSIICLIVCLSVCLLVCSFVCLFEQFSPPGSPLAST